MVFQETIARKRDGFALSAGEIDEFVREYTTGAIPDYQASALLMAIYLRGMDAAETAALTGAMAESGGQLDLSAIERVRPTIDKHSTGGVGDKASLIVVPILAAAGAAVCKMSGRGLGHTGGTLDKLESIPGFRIDLSAQVMIDQVARVGACIVGQTSDLAPADKRLYALRDATATVGSLPLIVSSILSKKLAGGARRFLFDVKVGGGALMKDMDDARALAHALVAGGTAHGRTTIAIITDMSQPLGRTAGNALEVAEAIALLTPTTSSAADPRLRDLCLYLAAEGLCLAGLALDVDAGRARAEALVASGAALRAFRDIVTAQGGDGTVIDAPERLPYAPTVRTIAAEAGGLVAAIDAEEGGRIVVRLGGGRARKENTIDPAVGVVLRASVGTVVAAGTPLAEIHARTAADADAARASLQNAFQISPEQAAVPSLIRGRITG